MVTKEDLKKQLHSYCDLKAESEQISLEIQKIEAFMTSPRGAGLGGMPRGTGFGDPLMDVVAQHLALQERYKNQLRKLAAAQSSIEDMIGSLEPVERKLLRHRYIEGLSWEEVCVAINYSWRQTHRMHGDALKKLLDQANS